MGRWFVSFSVEITRADPGPAQPGTVVGVDLGVKSLAVLSTGETLTTRLVRTFGVIVVEDLNVSGMVKNRRLARRVSGVGIAELRRQIEYKATWAGVQVYVADRWYPSSKTCSGCGVVKASELTFTLHFR